MKFSVLFFSILISIWTSFAIASVDGPINVSEEVTSETSIERQIRIISIILGVLDSDQLSRLKQMAEPQESDSPNLLWAKELLSTRVQKCSALKTHLDERYQPWRAVLEAIDGFSHRIAQEQDFTRRTALEIRRAFASGEASVRSVGSFNRGTDFIAAVYCNRFIDTYTRLVQDQQRYQR